MAILSFKDHFSNPKDEKKSKGFSGSKTLKSPSSDKWYQLKYSTKHKKKLFDKAKARLKGRGLIGGSLDHENIAELVIGDAANAMKSVLKGSTDIASPEIDFVGIDKSEEKSKREGIKIASEFIPEFRDLAGVFKKSSNLLKKNEEVRYLKVNFNSNQNQVTKKKKNKKGEILCSVTLGAKALDEKVQKGISDGVAMNAIFGNGDINAGGNMGVQVDKSGKPVNAAILDFGHGFNNLIQGPSRYGGGIAGDNGLLDYLNRDKVLKFPSGSPSKLWRDFEGLVPSEMFVESLKKVSSPEAQKAMQEGIKSSKEKLQNLKKEYESQGVSLDMLEKSLVRLNRNSGNPKVKYNNIDELIDKTASSLENFASKRMEEAKEVAKVMEIQLQIDSHIEQGWEIPKEVSQAYDKLNKNSEGKVAWVKPNAKEPAKVADLAEYVEQKRAELTQSKEQKTSKNSKKVSFAARFGSARKKVTKWAEYIIDRKNSGQSQTKGPKKGS